MTGNDLLDMSIAISFMAIGSGVIAGLIYKAIKRFRKLKEVSRI